MAKTEYDVGHYKIHKAVIRRIGTDQEINIANFIAALSFSESINSPMLIGKVLIADTFDFIHKIPLLGEEILYLEYTDFFDNRVRQTFYINTVDSLSPPDQSQGMGLGYYLNISSIQFLLSVTNLIQKSYTGTVSEIAERIFNEYLNNDEYPATLDIEDTTGTQVLVIPALSPFDAIDFCRRRAFSSDNKSSDFRFFTTKENAYKFITIEQLLTDTKSLAFEYFYDPALNANGGFQNRSQAMRSIQSIVFPQRFNFARELARGGIKNDIVEIDLLTKQYIHNEYDHQENLDQFKHQDDTIQSRIHTPRFIEKYMSEVVTSNLVFKDFTRDTQNYKNILGPRISTQYYSDMITCEIEIYGRNDLSVGDTMHLKIPQFRNLEQRAENETMGGYWTVHTINHNFTDKDYKSSVTLFKSVYKKNTVETLAEIST